MEIFKLFGSIFIKSDEAEKSIHKTESKAKQLVTAFGNGIKTAAKWGAGIAAGAAAAATAAVGALLKVDEATKEYRENMGKLNAAWEASGKDASLAKQAYEGLYGILGDQDAATEAAQLMAQLATNTQDVAAWSDIAAGAAAVFGESLPINTMVESAAESATLGVVTGDLSRMLAEAGIAEDEFNAKLAACGSEQERAKLITDTLSEAYIGAAESFKTNNEQTIKTREEQAKLDEAMAKLGGTVEAVKTGLKAEFVPAIADVVSAFSDFMAGAEDADVALEQAIQNMVDKVVQSLPEFLNFGIELIVQIATGLISNLPYLLKQIPTLIAQIVSAFLRLGGELYNVGKELFSELWNGLKGVWSSVSSWVSNKVSWLTDKLAFWKRSSSAMSTGGANSHASGLAYVPYDGYPATLHRGERVLTDRDAREMDKGKSKEKLDTDQPITIIVQSVLDGKVIGESVTRYQRNRGRAYG